MIPSVLSSQIQRGIEDFLKTTFPVSTPFFHGVMDRFLNEDGGIFKGPYLSIRLPYRTAAIGQDYFPGIPLHFTPYLHQEQAFRRLSGERPLSTIIATGTGSGKTESFLYPILDYCWRHRGEPGIKAIIIYPMNALATDQAKRIARLIDDNPNLKNQLKAGLYIGGQQGEKASQVMGHEQLITDRETLRLKPPDILLTNYKMLDYLLIRPRDLPLWKENRPETMKYLVVDEIHTFDGAQGTDLACLIRRLKSRLKMEKGHLCCVGTSATLGEGNDRRVGLYAEKVFGETFPPEAIITESLVTAEEFLADSPMERSLVIPPEQMAALNPDSYENDQAYLKAQYELWFGEKPINNETWPVQVAEKLGNHGFFGKLVLALNGRIVPIDELTLLFERFTPEFAAAPAEYKRLVMDSMIALISAARVVMGNGLSPFLNVRLQLWLRELRRIVGNVGEPPALRFSDDLRGEDQCRHLPVLHCRECGAMGWGGTKREQDQNINPDLQHFYASFFHYSPTVVALFPVEGTSEGAQQEFGWVVCGDCLHVALGENVKDAACPACGARNRLIPVFMPNQRRKERDAVKGSHDCPYCQGYNSLTILGSRAASLTSVAISQLYASKFNNDKKLLTFSDSVQDAAHRAGFFAARTYRFNLRGAIQKFLIEQATEQLLTKIPAGFVRYWQKKLGEETFIATFLPPDMAWLTDYEVLVESGKLPPESTLLEELAKRIDWEIISEYGFNSRIGRTLEKTSSSVACVEPARLRDAADALCETLRNEIGLLRDLDGETVARFLVGFLTQLRTKGALCHPALQTYVDNWGSCFLTNKIRWMPSFGRFSRTPAFLTTKRGVRFDTLMSGGKSRPTWYEDWLRKCFGSIHPQIGEYGEAIFPLVVQALVKKGICRERQVQGSPVWGIDADHLSVTRRVVQFRCQTCSHNVSVAAGEEALWQDNACLRYTCQGRYDREAPAEDYYGHLYATGDVQRLFAAEHTGLLKREKRETIEKRFMADDSPSGSPNLLSCTPTLELGIDIGDLSSVILCSVPPAQANYMQRIGRSGRKNGNSFNLTVANGRPHDLYFYAEPKAMLAGGMEPPGCFIDAPAVLERQMTAFCFDRWIESGIPVTAIPEKLGQVLGQLGGHGNNKKFPFNLIQYVEHHRSQLLADFISLFEDALTASSKEHIRGFIYGNAEGIKSLTYRIIERLTGLDKERASLRKRVQKLNQFIKEKEANPIRDQNYADHMDDLLREKAALNSIIRRMNEKEIYNFFTDEGLLPNYAFPEAGIMLQSIIYKKKAKPDKEGSYKTTTYEYERPAASAIHELAPDNHFYAEGRKVKVDQVNLTLSESEEWRFCDSCSHMELAATGDTTATCPSCGSVMWSDDGQKRRMIRMRQVMATTSDRDSRIQDDHDEREPEFFHKQLLLDMDESSVESAFKISDEDFPFGMEFVRKVTFREMNFGKRDNGSETILIAGKEYPKDGFAICRVCGKVQGNKEPRHTLACPQKDADPKKNILDFLYFYREFSSQALRILLPAKPLSSQDRTLSSFTAALYLGLKKKFEGNIDHLRTTIHEEPSPDHHYRKRYLVLYDMVPGGTGYLKELMQNEQPLMDVFQMALDTLKACVCHQDSEKDGCYRCLYAYRNNFERNNTSRDTAIELLSEILKRREHLVKTDSLKNMSGNPLLDSELEERFIEALRSYAAKDIKVTLRQEIVNQKPGWYLKVNDRAYYIVPQVELGAADGVAVPSRADFVFYPVRHNEGKPIAVFTDGFMYHAGKGDQNRIGKDMSQRMAIVRSKRYRVWSLSWDDVENSLQKKGGHYDNFLSDRKERVNALHAQYDDLFRVQRLAGLRDQSGFDMLMAWLADPEPRMWEMHALIHGLVHLDCSCRAEEGRSIADGLWQDAPWSEVRCEIKTDTAGNALAGLYRKDLGELPLIRLIACLAKEDYAENRFHKNAIICRFFDDDDLAETPHFKAAWNGFIRMYNIYQFIPNAIFITSKGIAEGQYLWLETANDGAVKKPESVSTALSKLMEVTDLTLHELLLFLAKHTLPLPEAGFELCNDKDEVVASGELCWPEKKIALLRGDEMWFAGVFTSRGWRTAPLDDLVREPFKCLELLQ
ncbi:MAG: DEAD/DEAH box helicase [Syntrophobacterales bacterium]|nr:DEAD/DEAH box helicase [Syntrophobacterales bacterium]